MSTNKKYLRAYISENTERKIEEYCKKMEAKPNGIAQSRSEVIERILTEHFELSETESYRKVIEYSLEKKVTIARALELALDLFFLS